MKYTIYRDSREQKPWQFRASANCEGCETVTLKTGDYTLKGFEDIFSLEKKSAGACEIYKNICTLDYKRFSNELIRLIEFKHAYVIIECSMDEIYKYPWKSDLPMVVKRKIGNKGDYLLKRFIEVQNQFPQINFILADSYGREVATSIFKRMVELYPERLNG